MKKKQRKRRLAITFHAKSVNLYKFIRLVIGSDIPDRQIAQRWGIDPKNFHEFKTGKYPVPRLSKLEGLALVLGINKHLVFQVAGGAPAPKVFNLIKTNDLAGQVNLLSNQLEATHRTLAKSEQRYRALFKHANDAIFIADLKTGVLLDCNHRAERLIDRSRNEIIGRHHSLIHPPEKKEFYKNYFKKFTGSLKDGIKTHEIFRADGTIIPASISASVIEIGGKEVIQGIIRDVSRIKQSGS